MSNLRATKGETAKAAKLAEAKRISKYGETPSHLLFMPIAVETLGSYGPQAASFIKELGKRQAEQFGDDTAGSSLRQRFSVELQRGDAKCVTFSLTRCSLSLVVCVCAHMPLIRITRCHARRAQADIREHRKGERERARLVGYGSKIQPTTQK